MTCDALSYGSIGVNWVKLKVLHGPVDVWTSIHFAVPVEEERLVFFFPPLQWLQLISNPFKAR